jgi:hypothetical protein
MHVMMANRAADRVAHLMQGYKPCQSWEGMPYACNIHTARATAYNARVCANRASIESTIEGAEKWRRRAEWNARRAELAMKDLSR